HLVGHGNERGIYYETDAFFNNTDADTVTNMPYINILNSIGCMCGATDYVSGGDCFAEKLVNNPDGGALAVIFNSRFGWGDPPSFGPSDRIDSLFYHVLFHDSIYTLGAIHNLSKNGFVPNISWYSTWAWCIYELNLFGDPELDVFTDYPQSLTATYDDVVPLGNVDYEFNVMDLLSSAVISNARICIMNDSSYAVGYTDINGDATINIDVLSSDSMDITITAHNYFPYENKVLIASGNPNRPIILSMPKCVLINILNPEIVFRATDNENDNILYLIEYDDNNSFSSSDSVTTALYASGDTANFVFPSLSDNITYYYKIRAKDPSGSNYWSLHSGIRSFTLNTGLGSDNCAFYQHNNYQFSFNSFTGTQIQGDSIVLINNMGTGFDSLYCEDFEGGVIPAEWTIVNPNGDAYTWSIVSGSQADLGGSPPSSGTYYVYYSDDDASSSAGAAIESAISPAIYINGIDSLNLNFSYAFRNYLGEEFSVDIETFNGSWSNTNIFSTSTTSSNTRNIDVSSYMPAESIRVIFNYDDNGNWGWAAGFDNVLFGNEYPIYTDSGSFTTASFAYSDLYNIYSRTHWGYAYWVQSSINDSIIVRVQYCDSDIWNDIPNADLPGNLAGFTTIYRDGSIDLTALDESIYDTLRLDFCMFTDTLNPDDIPSILEIEIGNLNEHLTGINETNISAINTDKGILLKWEALSNNMKTNPWIIKRKDHSGNIKSFTVSTNSLMDNEIKPGMKYNYSVFDNNTLIGSVSIIANKLLDYSFNLIGNNPGINFPTIRYSLPVKQFVSISLYDITGRNIAMPINEICNAGIYSFSMNNLSFVSGTYFVIYKAGNFEAVRKFTILK
ncbi:T9SS type A sorting domain-containing protein, partial [candidate division WOR-3 bacterium]|nr:T9SS type A sorting domain-containing protein [candidate division WOR-3 bacterium]